MRKILVLIFMIFGFAAGAADCKNPELYGLGAKDVRNGFYCWELKYMKEYKASSVVYKEPLPVKNIEMLRERGITPEKANYLALHFMDENFKSAEAGAQDAPRASHCGGKEGCILDVVVGRATRELGRFKSEFEWRDNGAYGLLPLACTSAKDKKFPSFGTLPLALQPAGVIGSNFVNAFGEVVGEVRVEPGNKKPSFVDNGGNVLGKWDIGRCGLTDISEHIKRKEIGDLAQKLQGNKYACTPCRIFEIAFNSVSRVAFVLYDKVAREGLKLLMAAFLVWMCFVFFDKVVKGGEGDGEGFVTTFFTKSVWVFIVAVFMSVSIKDENNIFNYTIRPLTEFMSGFAKTTTQALDKKHGAKEWECRYAQLEQNPRETDKVLFPREVRKDIVCSIERIADFNHLNIVIGRWNAGQGVRNIVGGDVGGGVAKILLGLGIMALFWIMNLAIPYYFIESIFMIGVLVVMLPLILIGFAIDKVSGLKMKAYDLLMSAIMQIVSLSIVCLVISVLMMYSSGTDFYNIYDAARTSEAQGSTNEMLYILSFNSSDLLRVFYTAMICWWLVGQAVNIANGFGNSAQMDGGLAKKFIEWERGIVASLASVAREKATFKNTVGALKTRMKNERK